MALDSTALVVTSISGPNPVLRDLAEGCARRGMDFILIGDTRSPEEFFLEGCRYYSIADQHQTGLSYARLCPTGHYARKNIGYLEAIRAGAGLILETDDDNLPTEGFWLPRHRTHEVPVITQPGWVNIYRYFTDSNIWPRGLPLDMIKREPPVGADLEERRVTCPIQQGLSDQNPDVDAVYRLSLPLPQCFEPDKKLALAPNSWSPFNSQNTCWWPEAYALMYLPAHCSFRMTDIWRGFVALRIAAAYGWHILFESPTTVQDRNDHDLMRDFADEIPGYLNNGKLMKCLHELELSSDPADMGGNLRRCYRALVENGFIPSEELALVEAWLMDLEELV